jgi:DinB superfamily
MLQIALVVRVVRGYASLRISFGREDLMKRMAWMTLTLLLALFAARSAKAQEGSAPVANPVTSTVKAQLTRYAKNMVAAADLMPADKFSFKPTPEMNTFGHLTMHIAQSNNFLCSKISGTAAPDVKLADTDTKDKLVAALKASFEYCTTALANVDDSKLGDPLTLFGNRPATRAGALIALSDDWYDHYGAQAVYLRLNGILPPTAQPKPQ